MSKPGKRHYIVEGDCCAVSITSGRCNGDASVSLSFKGWGQIVFHRRAVAVDQLKNLARQLGYEVREKK